MKRALIVLLLASLTMPAAAEKVADLSGIGSPYPMAVDHGRLIVVDGFVVHVYSLEPFALRQTFGGEGTGPGQFQYAPRIYTLPDSIVVIDFMKTVWFSRDGKLEKEKRYEDFEDFDPATEMLLIPVASSYVRITVDHEAMKRRAVLLDSELRPVKTLHEGSFDWNKPDTPFNPLPHRIHVVCDQGKVFVSDSERGFFITVFDHRGEHLRTIDKSGEVERIEIDAGARARIADDIRRNQPQWVADKLAAARFPEHYPLLHHFQISGDKIYATTHREADGKHEMLVLDLEGKILGRAFLAMASRHPYRRILRSDLYDVDQGKLYELIKNAATGVWELHVTDVDRHLGK